MAEEDRGNHNLNEVFDTGKSMIAGQVILINVLVSDVIGETPGTIATVKMTLEQLNMMNIIAIENAIARRCENSLITHSPQVQVLGGDV